MIIKTDEELEYIRESGRRLSRIRGEVASAVRVGVLTSELNDLAERLIIEGGDVPAFLNYTPKGAKRAYPATLCVSVNDEIVHGIPNENPRELKEGDIVGLDFGLIHKSFVTDSAVTVPVGNISNDIKKLLNTTKEALARGISAARAGGNVGDIGYAIESFVDGRYGIIKELGGHGVGKKVHEDPYIPNFGAKGTGEKLKEGMVIAIEPMLNMGSAKITLDADGYTFRTADGKESAHFEHTILIKDGDAEILTL